jgi:hypothetical protein
VERGSKNCLSLSQRSAPASIRSDEQPGCKLGGAVWWRAVGGPAPSMVRPFGGPPQTQAPRLPRRSAEDAHRATLLECAAPRAGSTHRCGRPRARPDRARRSAEWRSKISVLRLVRRWREGRGPRALGINNKSKMAAPTLSKKLPARALIRAVANVRYAAHSGLDPDIAQCLRSAINGHRVAIRSLRRTQQGRTRIGLPCLTNGA